MGDFEEFPLNEDFQGYAATSKISPESRDFQGQSNKRRRTKPCTHCRKRKTKCVRLAHNEKCTECSKRTLECVVDDSKVPYISTNSSCDNCQFKRKHCTVNFADPCYECMVDGIRCISTGVGLIVNNSTVIHVDRVTLGVNSAREKNLMPWSLSPLPGTPKFQQSGNYLQELCYDLHHQLSQSFVNEINATVGSVCVELIDLFLKYFQSSIPILTIHQVHELNISLKSPDSIPNPLLLVMIYLHSFKFLSVDSTRANLTIDITRLENLAIILANEFRGSKSLDVAQGFVLLVHYKFRKNTSHNENSWKFLDRAVEVVEGCGAHFYLDESSSRFNQLLLEIIKVDKFVSLLSLRPQRTNRWDIGHVDIRAGIFSTDRNRMIYLAVLELARTHCESLIVELFSYKALKNDNFEQCLSKSKTFQAAINHWFESLAPVLTSALSINLHFHLLIFLNFRRLINKAIDEQVNINSLKPIVERIIKRLSSFNDILLDNGSKLISILQYQILPNYLIQCFTNYYTVLKLLSNMQFNVTALLQSFELKSRQLSQLADLSCLSPENLETLQSLY